MTEIERASDRTPLIPSRFITSRLQNEEIPDSKPPRNMASFIVVVALERFTYYSIMVNLFLFFKDDVYRVNDRKYGFGKGPTEAIVSVMLLVGLSWLFCVLGSWLSDARLGKLKTIIWGLFMYALGTGLLLVSAFCVNSELKDEATSYRALIVFASIIIALIGEGAVKANIAVFGAEQLDKKDTISTRRYFNFYYFSINIGVFFALLVTSYIQQWKGFIIGFAIPFASITLALLIFILSQKRYETLPCRQIVGKVFRILKEARKNYRRNGASTSVVALQQKMMWLDHARIKYGGSYLDWEVDEVRFLVAIIPVMILLLPFQTIYNQMYATFLQQGIHMRIQFDNFDTFPVAWLICFNAGTITVLLPIMEKFVYPCLTKRGYNMTPLTRISIGVAVACFAIITAGFVDIWVGKDFMANKTVVNANVNGHDVTAADLSVLYQAPQYFLIGVSEIFASVGGLDFAYRNAPRSMQSMVMALYFTGHSLGSLLGVGLLELSKACGLVHYKGHGSDEQKYYDVTYYFFLLGGLMLLSWIVFIIYVERNRKKRLKLPRTRMFIDHKISSPPDIDACNESLCNNR